MPKASNPLRVKLTGPQREFLKSTATYPAFVAGFGAGKSEVMAVSACGDAAHSSEALIGLYAPTYDLVRLITAPRICAKLDEFGIPHRWNKQENIVYTSWPRFGDFLLRTMDNPERIVGYETYRAHLDELDTLKADKAREVWNKVIGRNRQKPAGVANPFNRVSVYTTPEGFRFVYERWKRRGTEKYQIIQAPTYSNPMLAPDYIDNLRATYPDELLSAYIEGEFVNLTSGTVYRAYDRQANRSTEMIRGNEPLHIGMDFNTANMSAVIFVERGEDLHAVAEIKGVLDTPEMIRVLAEKYEGHHVTVYPDASGGARKSVNASESDISLLRRAKFRVRVNKTNPAVKDRVLSVNAALGKGRVWVNDTACRTLAECLEQQSYDKNGEPDKTTGHDHMNDAAGYCIHWMKPVVKPRFETRELRL